MCFWAVSCDWRKDQGASRHPPHPVYAPATPLVHPVKPHERACYANACGVEILIFARVVSGVVEYRTYLLTPARRVKGHYLAR